MTKFLNFLTYIVFGLFWITLVTIDSISWKPFLICMACWIWLMVAAWKNNWFYDPELEEADADD